MSIYIEVKWWERTTRHRDYAAKEEIRSSAVTTSATVSTVKK